DLQSGFVLLGYVARRAADAADLSVLVVGNAGIDPDPAVAAIGRKEMREVVLDLAVAAQGGEEPAVGKMRGAGLGITEATAQQLVGRHSESVERAVVQVGEAALGVGGPDQVMRGFHQVAIAALALEQQLDDASLFAQGLARDRQLILVLVAEGAERRARQSVDDLARVAPMPAVGATRDQNALAVPAAQLLHGDAELGRGFLNRVFGR